MNNLRHFAMSLAFVFGGVITGCSSDGSDENSESSHGSVSSIEQGSASSTPGGSSSANSFSGGRGSTSSTSSASSTSVSPAGGSSVGSSGSTVLQCGQILSACSADANCCAEYACVSGMCRERLLATGGSTSTSTTTPVTTGGSSAGLCMPLNGPCETSSICCNAQQCISGYCGGPAVQTSSGGSTSTSTTTPVTTGGSSSAVCGSMGKSCSVNSECCSSLTCQSFQCLPPLVAVGGGVGTGGTSSTSTGGSIVPACMSESQACSVSATCCASLTCQNGFCRYAALATGGTSGVGGSSETTAVAGYTSLSGGSSATGGTEASGGSTVVVATGGSSACTPASRPVSTSTSSTALTCGQPIRDSRFPESSLNFVDRFAAISSTDIVAIGHTLALQGFLYRWNQSATVWEQDVSFPTYDTETSVLLSVARKDADIMIVGGNAQCTGCLLVPHAWYGWKTTWVDVRQGLPAHGSVVDVTFIQGKGYALVNNDDAGSAEVYKLNVPAVGESVFSWSRIASFSKMIASKMFATSEQDMFAVGGRMVNGVYTKGLIFHFDGCSWSEVSLPSDITRIISFHGSEGAVIALGYTGTQKARLTATDLSSWTRSSGDDSLTIDSAVWMKNPSAALIGGAGKVNGNGSAWISTGLSPWTASALDSAYADGVNDIAPVPGTNTFLIGSKQMVGGTFESRAYRVTCQ